MCIRDSFWDCPLDPDEPLSTLARRWASRFHDDGEHGVVRLEAEEAGALSLDFSGADLDFPLNVAFVNVNVLPEDIDAMRRLQL